MCECVLVFSGVGGGCVLWWPRGNYLFVCVHVYVGEFY